MSPCGAHPRGTDLSSSHTMTLASTVSPCIPRTLKKCLFILSAIEYGEQRDQLRWDRAFQDKKIKVCLRESMEHAPALQQPPKDGARVEINPPIALQGSR